jgi:hypothetical protein
MTFISRPSGEVSRHWGQIDSEQEVGMLTGTGDRWGPLISCLAWHSAFTSQQRSYKLQKPKAPGRLIIELAQGLATLGMLAASDY